MKTVCAATRSAAGLLALAIPVAVACLVGGSRAADDFGEAPAGAVAPEYLNVVGTTDFNGELTVQIVAGNELADLRKSVDLDNKAMSRAYKNVKDRAIDKIRAENEAKRREYAARNYRGNRNVQSVRFKSYEFPMDEPAPRTLQLLGRYRDSALAEKTKQCAEERETARQERLKAAAGNPFENAPKTQLKKVEYKKRAEETVPPELVKALRDEFDKVKQQMQSDPAYEAAGGRKTGVDTTAAVQPKTPSRRLGDPRAYAPLTGPKGGRRLGE